jgi:hypothetical protein
LQQEGQYSLNITNWRSQRERGELEGLVSNQRGPKTDLQAVEVAQLIREK